MRDFALRAANWAGLSTAGMRDIREEIEASPDWHEYEETLEGSDGPRAQASLELSHATNEEELWSGAQRTGSGMGRTVEELDALANAVDRGDRSRSAPVNREKLPKIESGALSDAATVSSGPGAASKPGTLEKQNPRAVLNDWLADGWSQRLLNARISQDGMTQKQAAYACGVREETYERWERGQHPPALRNMLSLLAFVKAGEMKAISQVAVQHPSSKNPR